MKYMLTLCIVFSFLLFVDVLILLLSVLPESPRWLYTKGRYREADAVMAKFAKWNGYPRLLVRVETTKVRTEVYEAVSIKRLAFQIEVFASWG